MSSFETAILGFSQSVTMGLAARIVQGEDVSIDHALEKVTFLWDPSRRSSQSSTLSVMLHSLRSLPSWIVSSSKLSSSVLDLWRDAPLANYVSPNVESAAVSLLC